MSLESEMRTYLAHLPNLRADEGKYVLIKGDHVIDTFAAYEDALKRGYQEFGLQPFMVKRIAIHEEAQMITRLVVPVHAAID